MRNKTLDLHCELFWLVKDRTELPSLGYNDVLMPDGAVLARIMLGNSRINTDKGNFRGILA